MENTEAQKKFREALEKNPDLKAETFELAVRLFDILSKDAVRRGRVDIRGKTPKEAIEILQDYALSCCENGEFVAVIDHRTTLLEEARSLATRDQDLLAIMLYATYFEHALNDIILVGGEKCGLSEALCQRLIRSASMHDKLRDLFEELDMPPLPQGLVEGVKKLSAIRNEFIHYKWAAHPEEKVNDARDKHVHDMLALAEGLVGELSEYVKQHQSADYDKIFEGEFNQSPETSAED